MAGLSFVVGVVISIEMPFVQAKLGKKKIGPRGKRSRR
jgi:hypothetical protein